MGSSSQRSWRDVVKFGGKAKKEPSILLLPLPHIPEEIISNMLPRLPLKSLLRFKCVSKLWNSIISDPEFTLLNPKSMLVLMSSEENKGFTVRFVRSHGSVKRVSISLRIITPEHYDYYHRDYTCEFIPHIAGTCDGMLLLRSGTDFILWNLLTSTFFSVLEETCTHPYYFDDPGYGFSISGFFYDSLKDDYKVVIGFERHFGSNASRDRYVIVAGLKDKYWKEIEFPYRPYGKENGVLFNGFLHWTVVHEWKVLVDRDRDYYPYDRYQKTYSRHMIIALDPHTDEVQEVPFPPTWNKENIYVLGLGILDGCLCMTCWYEETSSAGSVQVFAMKEYGNEESWIPLFEVWNLDNNPFSNVSNSTLQMRNGEIFCPLEQMRSGIVVLTPLLRMRNGEVLMRMDSGTIFGYNPGTKKLRYYGAKGAAKGYEKKSCDVIVESFAWHTGYRFNEEQHQGKIILKKWHGSEEDFLSHCSEELDLMELRISSTTTLSIPFVNIGGDTPIVK